MTNVRQKQRKHIAEDILTPKQEAFCRYYVDTGNASEAYRMAYNTERMKPESIWSNASQLLSNTKVTLRVEEIRREYAEASKIERQKVERVLMDIVSADPSELYVYDEKTGKYRMKSPCQMPRRVRNVLKTIKNNRGVVSYEFNGKTEAARLLGAWNGWNAPTQIDIGGKAKQELMIGFDDEG